MDIIEVQALIKEAQKAFDPWKKLSIQARGKYLLKVRDIIYQRMDEIAEVISKTSGKPKFESLTAEIIPVLDLIPTFVKRAPKILKDRSLPLHLLIYKKSYLMYEPYGVVAILSPWNYPFSIPMGEVVLALLAGNTVSLKVSELAFPVGEIIKEIFELAMFPKGVVNVLFGDGQTGAALVNSPDIQKISFTGSTNVGAKILEQAAKNITPCLLELGGKDATIVCEDADLKKAATGIVWGAFSNSGQVCASVQRAYVAEKVYENFLDLVVQETKKLKMKEEVGAITLLTQMERYERQLADALSKGAKLHTGGQRQENYFLPTVLSNVNHSMLVMKEETFGPFLPIMSVNFEEEAIQLTNDSAFGLCASVWTKDVSKGLKLARQIQAGTITVNDCVYTHALAETPWGGYKKSGIGRTHSDLGLLEFVQAKHINYDRIDLGLFGLKPFWWFPYTPKSYQTATAFANFVGAPTFGKKIKYAVQFLKSYLLQR